MQEKPIIKTDRLILRQWQQEDFEPFAHINADIHVMRFFPSSLNRKQSDELAKKLQALIEEKGWGFWAVSLIQTNEFIGFIGLNEVSFKAHFTPAVEIGWRLSFEHWGKGYASEGARASLKYGFETLKLDEIVSFTAVQNMRSRHVMERLHMHHDVKEDFDHPNLPEGHDLKRHVLYRLKKTEWRNQFK